MVMRQGLTMVVAGLIVGLAGAFALSRILTNLLFDTMPTDLSTFAKAMAGGFPVSMLAGKREPMSLVADAPNPETGKRVLDFILSDEGQAIWTNAYLQPARPVELPADVADKFLPASDYERAVAVDYAEMERAQAAFGERYLNEVK